MQSPGYEQLGSGRGCRRECRAPWVRRGRGPCRPEANTSRGEVTMSNSFIPRTVPADRCVPLVRALVAMLPTSYRLPTMGTACSHRTRHLGQ